MHEMITRIVFIKKLVWASFDPGNIDLHPGCKSVFDDTSGGKVLEFGPDKSGTLARLYVLELYDGIKIVVVFKA
jgi:hypothetical protein